MSTLRTDVSGCSRCGENHLNLEFLKFQKQPVYDEDGVVWDYWAVCPVLLEPVLLRSDLYNEMVKPDGLSAE